MRIGKHYLPNHGTGKRKNTDGTILPGFYVQWVEYTNDKRSQRSGHFDTKAQAQKYCGQQNARLELNLLCQPKSITIRDALAEFAAGLSAVSAETVRAYSVSIGLFKNLAGNIHVCDVTPTHIDKFISERMAAGTEATASKHVRHLKRFFNWCAKRTYWFDRRNVPPMMMVKSPIDLATSLPKNGIAREVKMPTADQFMRLIFAVGGPESDRGVAVWLAGTTGLDRKMIEHLAPDDIDWDESIFKLVRKKTGKRIDALIHKDLIPALRQKCEGLDPHERIFRGLSHQGGPGDWWARAVGEAGISYFRFVDLRKHAKYWMAKSLGDFEASKRLGHTTPTVTYNHYHSANSRAQQLISEQPLPGSGTIRLVG